MKGYIIRNMPKAGETIDILSRDVGLNVPTEHAAASQKLAKLKEALQGSKQILDDAGKTFKSDAAQRYLKKAGDSIISSLLALAEKGKELRFKVNKSDKEGAESAANAVENMASSLSASLEVYKSEIEKYKKIEVAKKELDELKEKAEKRAKGKKTKEEIMAIETSTSEILASLKRAEEGLPDSLNTNPVLLEAVRHDISYEYAILYSQLVEMRRAKAISEHKELFVFDEKGNFVGISDNINGNTDEVKDIKKLFAEKTLVDVENDKKTLHSLEIRFADIENQIKQFEKKPDSKLLMSIEELTGSTDLETLGNNMFGPDMQASSGTLISNEYQKLWQGPYSALKRRFETINGNVDRIKKNSKQEEGRICLEAIGSDWNERGEVDFKKYLEAIDQNNNDLMKELEDRVLVYYLNSNDLMKRFVDLMKDESNIGHALKEKYELINQRLNTIKSNKVKRLDSNWFKEFRGEDLSKYVKINYDSFDNLKFEYTDLYNKLNDEAKKRVDLLVRTMLRDNRAKVTQECSDLFEKSRQGEKDDGIYNKYKELLKGVADLFFEAVPLVKSNPLEAERKFKIFVSIGEKSIESKEPREKEILSSLLKEAKDYIQKFNMSRADALVEMYEDVISMSTRGRVGNELSVEDGVLETKNFSLRRELSLLRTKVLTGEIFDFEQAYNDLKTKIEKVKGNSVLFDKLNSLYEGLFSDDPLIQTQKLEEFAREATNNKDYETGKKYYGLALRRVFEKKKAEMEKKGEIKSVEDIRNRIIHDPRILADIHKQAENYVATMKREYPDMNLSLDAAEKILIEQQVKARYKHTTESDIRFALQRDGFDKTNSTFRNFQKDYPQIVDEWRPWTWGAKEWDDFQEEAFHFVIENLPTLGSAALAGAAGKAVTKKIVQEAVKRGISAEAVKLIEKEGITTALKAVSKKEAAQLIGVLAVAQVGSIAAESAVFTLSGQAVEYTRTGHASAFESVGTFGEVLGRSALTMGLLRSLGAAYGGIGMGSSTGLKGLAERAAIETTNATALTGMDLYLSHGQMSSNDILKGYLSNYFLAIGHGIGSRVHEAGAKNSSKANDRMTREGRRVDTERSMDQFRDEVKKGKWGENDESKVKRNTEPVDNDRQPIEVHRQEAQYFSVEDKTAPETVNSKSKTKSGDQERKNYTHEYNDVKLSPELEQFRDSVKWLDGIKGDLIVDNGVYRHVKNPQEYPTTKERGESVKSIISNLETEGTAKNNLSTYLKNSGIDVKTLESRLHSLSDFDLEVVKTNLGKLDPALTESLLNQDYLVFKNALDGKLVRVYMGAKLGEGGFGVVSRSALLSGNNIELGIHAVKMPRDAKTIIDELRSRQNGKSTQAEENFLIHSMEHNFYNEQSTFIESTGRGNEKILRAVAVSEQGKGKRPIIVMEEVIDDGKGLSVKDSLRRESLTNTLQTINDGLEGVIQAIAMGKLPQDFKLENILRKLIEGKISGVLSDLAFIDIKDLPSIELMGGAVLKMDADRSIQSSRQFGITPEFFSTEAMNRLVTFAKTHKNQPIPRQLIEAVVIGTWGRNLQRHIDGKTLRENGKPVLDVHGNTIKIDGMAVDPTIAPELKGMARERAISDLKKLALRCQDINDPISIRDIINEQKRIAKQAERDRGITNSQNLSLSLN